jgi:hypothetical protein
MTRCNSTMKMCKYEVGWILWVQIRNLFSGKGPLYILRTIMAAELTLDKLHVSMYRSQRTNFELLPVKGLYYLSQIILSPAPYELRNIPLHSMTRHLYSVLTPARVNSSLSADHLVTRSVLLSCARFINRELHSHTTSYAPSHTSIAGKHYFYITDLRLTHSFVSTMLPVGLILLKLVFLSLCWPRVSPRRH